MITCRQILEIFNDHKLGDLLEMGISPFNYIEYRERGGDIGTWMKPKSQNEITIDDYDKIVIAIKINNSNKMSHFKFCEKLLSCMLTKEFYVSTFQSHEEPRKRYFVKLQEYVNKITVAKIYPIENKKYICDFKDADETMFSDIPANVELHNKICFFGSPAIFE